MAQVRQDRIQVRLELDGKPVLNTIRDLQAAYKQTARELAQLPIGSEAYVRKAQEMASIKKLLDEQRAATAGYAGALDALSAGSIAVLSQRAKELTKSLKGMTEGTEEYTAASRELSQVEAEMDAIAANAEDANKALNRIEAGSLKALEQDAKRLREELSRLAPGTDAFVKKAGELAKVETEIRKVEDAAKDLGVQPANLRDAFSQAFTGILSGTVSLREGFGLVGASIKGMVAASGILFLVDSLVSLGREAFQANAKISDSVANVQKTTGLTRKELDGLVESLKARDTRTSIFDQLDITRIAGQLGIGQDKLKQYREELAAGNREAAKFTLQAATDELAGFTASIDKAAVALGDELEGGVEGVASSLGKLSVIFKTQAQFGAGESIERIGSAINELGNAGTATGGFLVDFSNRLAGIAPQANVTVQETLAIGAVLDELGQSAEVGGTSISTFFRDVGNNVGDFARIAGKPVEEFRQTLATSGTEAFLQILDGVGKTEGGVEALSVALNKLGIDDARAAGIFGALTNNTELLRDRIETANVAFAENVSLSSEFAVKNDTLAAKVDKLKNSFVNFITSAPVGQFFGAIIDAVGAVGAALGELGGFLATTLRPAFDTLRNAVRGAAEVFRPLLERLNGSGKAGEALRAVLNVILVPLKILINTVAFAVTVIGGWIDILIKAAQGNNVLGRTLRGVADTVQDYYKKWLAFVNFIGTLPAYFAGVFAAIRQGAENFARFFTRIFREAQIGVKQAQLAVTFDTGAADKLRAEIDALKAQRSDAAEAGKTIGEAYREAYNKELAAIKPPAAVVAAAPAGKDEIQSLSDVIKNQLANTPKDQKAVLDAISKGKGGDLTKDNLKAIEELLSQDLTKSALAELKKQKARILGIKPVPPTLPPNDDDKAAEVLARKEEEYAKMVADAQRRIEELQLQLIEDATEGRIAALVQQGQRELEAVQGTEQQKIVQQALIRQRLISQIQAVETEATTERIGQLQEAAQAEIEALEGNAQEIETQAQAIRQRFEVQADTLRSESLQRVVARVNELSEAEINALTTAGDERIAQETAIRQRTATQIEQITLASSTTALSQRIEQIESEGAAEIAALTTQGDERIAQVAQIELRVQQEIERVKAAAATGAAQAQLEGLETLQTQITQRIGDQEQADYEARLRAAEQFYQQQLLLANQAAMGQIEAGATVTDAEAALRDAQKAAYEAYLQQKLALEQQYGANTLQTEQEIVTAQTEQRKLEVQQAQEITDQKLQRTQQAIQAVGAVVQGLDTLNEAITKGQLARLEEQKAQELERVGNNAAAREAIELRYDKKQAEIEQKAAARRKAIAIADKGIAISNTIVNTAQGISKTIAQLGFPAAIPFIVLAGAAGALQIATIAAQKFEDGGVLPGAGGVPKGASHSGGGIVLVERATGRVRGEIEGGEPILSRETYANNREVVDRLLYSSMRQGGTRVMFQDGGILAAPSTTPLPSVVERAAQFSDANIVRGLQEVRDAVRAVRLMIGEREAVAVQRMADDYRERVEGTGL